MNRIQWTIAAGCLAAGVGHVSMAAESSATTAPNDETQVVPSRQAVQSQGAPAVRKMDDNVQRQHDRDQAADAHEKTKSGMATDTHSGTQAASGATRDWDKIDVNNDNLIQPAEMESWLKQVGPQARQ